MGRFAKQPPIPSPLGTCGHQACLTVARTNIKNQLVQFFRQQNGDVGCCSKTMKERNKHLKSLDTEELWILYTHEFGREPMYACIVPHAPP